MYTDLVEDFEKVADKSIKETIEAFFEYPSGFHGDTGIQHYLYHKVMSNASSKISWRCPEDPNHSTLLFQSEVYTACTYSEKGTRPGRGRFDMAFVAPPKLLEYENGIIHGRLQALIAFEVGRNKGVEKMGDFRAPKE